MKHYIIVKWNDQLPDKDAVVEDVRRIFAPALEIEGCTGLHVYPSCSNRSNRHDLMIEMILTPEALTVYDKSDFHHYWKDNYSKYIEHKTIFDCE